MFLGIIFIESELSFQMPESEFLSENMRKYTHRFLTSLFADHAF